jgi:SAM-dependent methyltransferase
MTAWHEIDDFWETMAPKIFGKLHWSVAPAEVDDIVAMLGIPPGADVLDLCCGPGRHSLELARRGFRVTGVDRTPAYLTQASEKAEVEGLSVEFVEGDMREFRRPDAFDAILNLYSSFGYFEDADDDKQVLDNAYACLRGGGGLLMDMMGKEVVARIFRERDWYEEDGVFFLEERSVDPGWGAMRNRWLMIRDGERFEFEFHLRLFSGQELDSMLRDAGFGSVELFGDLKGGPYDQTAGRLVALARK